MAESSQQGSRTESRDVDVIVVGAGLSGLTAAKLLLSRDSNLDVVVLEGKDRVGGRTKSVKLQTGHGTDCWDIGGQWIGRCQPHIMALVEELGLETHKQYIAGTKFLQVGRNNQITSYTSDIPTLSLVGLVDLHRIMKKTDELSAQIDPEDPFSCEKSEFYDSTTLETFINGLMWTQEAKDVIQAALRTMFGAETSQISALYFLTYIAGGGNIKNLVEAGENTAQEYRVKGGSQQISQKLCELIGPDKVLLNQPVLKIDQSESKAKVISSNGNVYSCRKIIIAIPPSQIGKISFSPLLPVETREIVKRMPPSSITKIIVTFKQAFWRDAGQSGEVVTNGGASTCIGCDKGPLCVTYDAMSPNGNPALLAFIGGKQAVQWQKENVMYESRRSAVLKSLAEFFGDQVYAYIDYAETIWDEEPFNDGAPVSCVGPGAMTYYAKGLRQQFGLIHFAGTESATVFAGFMNGAVQAGRRAAIEVLYDLRPQLVTSQDLLENRQRRKPLKKKSSVRRKLVKWTVYIGVASVAVYSVKKLYQKYS